MSAGGDALAGATQSLTAARRVHAGAASRVGSASAVHREPRPRRAARHAAAATAAMLAGYLVASSAAAQDAPPPPPPAADPGAAAAAATTASQPASPPAPPYASPEARRYASTPGAGPLAPSAVPPPIPVVRQRAYPVLVPLGVVAASVGMGVGLIAATISLANAGSYQCDGFGCRTISDNDGPITVASIGAGAALVGVGLIIAGATLDGPIVPVASPRPPPPPRRRDPPLQLGRIF
jgi:hypothetical protein